jgi:branched-chain amino acid transport system ATP-binding protein
VADNGLALKVSGIDVHYGEFHALWNVSFEVKKGEVVSIIATNGSGKSTLLNTIAGISAPTTGTIEYFGEDISGLDPYQTVARGIALVPEGRRVFSRMSVVDNLIMGSYTHQARKKREESLAKVYELFPRLKERRSQRSDTLSGGEQQMLAVGRALMSDPKLLLCDEISLGLAPLIIKDIYRRLRKINEEGITLVLVEQDITRSLKAANYSYVMLEGKVVLEGRPEDFTEEQVKKAYFGM